MIRAGRFGALVARRLPRDDRGSAIIEFIFVALVMFVPLIYVLVAVSVVQRSQLAVSDAAREAGRAYATSATSDAAATRLTAAVRLALAAQGLPDDAVITVVAADASCTSDPVAPSLAPGAVFTVCVTRRVAVPAIPTLLAGRGITSVGSYVVHVDDYRAQRP